VSVLADAGRSEDDRNVRRGTEESPSVSLDIREELNARAGFERKARLRTERCQRLHVLSASGRRGGVTNAIQNE
jgi:hypothetical protein